jgi:hypothetical protein
LKEECLIVVNLFLSLSLHSFQLASSSHYVFAQELQPLSCLVRKQTRILMDLEPKCWLDSLAAKSIFTVLCADPLGLFSVIILFCFVNVTVAVDIVVLHNNKS